MGKQNRQLGSGYFTRVSRERCVLASSYLPVCLFVSVSVCPSVYLSVCLSVSAHLSVSVCLPVCLSVSAHLSVCVCPLSVCLYQRSSHWMHFPEIWYVCRETANSVKIWQNYRSHEYPSVFHIVDSDVCRASLATLSEFITLLRMTYLRQQYYGNSLFLLRWQQWLRERPAMLRYTYVAYLFIATIWFRLSSVYFSICLFYVKPPNIALLGIGHLNWNWKALIRNSG